MHPPSELLLMSSTSTVKQVHAAAEDALRDVYTMFSTFKVRDNTDPRIVVATHNYLVGFESLTIR